MEGVILALLHDMLEWLSSTSTSSIFTHEAQFNLVRNLVPERHRELPLHCPPSLPLANTT
jgi:hypothetical protein